MNRPTLRLLALCAVFFTAGHAFGENQPKPVPAIEAGKSQKVVKIATLSTAKANQEFQANVQFLQVQRQQAVELNAKIDKEKDAKKKAELKKQLDQLMADLNANNEKMAKTYGFSLTRNYVLEVEVSNIYLVVSDEEAAKIEKEEKAKAAAAAAKK